MKNAELVDRITDYLSKGGLFNPELMEHDKVRQLLIDCREALTTPPAPECVDMGYCPLHKVVHYEY